MKQILFFLIFVCGLAAPTVLGQSAIGQLEEITGQRIDRGHYSGYYDTPSPSVPDQAYYDDQFTTYYHKLAEKENIKGARAFEKGKWAKAKRHFKRASKFNHDINAYQANIELCTDKIEKEKEKKAEIKRFKKIDKVFLKSVNKDIKTYSDQLSRLRKNLKGVVPPLTTNKKTIHEGLILGLFNTQTENLVGSVKSPFTGKPFGKDEFFATSDNTTNKELIRGVMDNNFLGKYTLKSEWGRQLVEKLNGTHFNRLYAHSNGATVSEALIREGVISVDELNVIGGDRSYINYFGYNELIASGKVKRIIVWVNPGDIIPMGSTAGLLTPVVGEKDEYLKNMAAFVKYKLTGSNGGAGVEYRYLKGPQYTKGQNLEFNKKIFDAHGIDAYFENMLTFFNPSN